jgi:hypothetical protein
MQVFLVVCIRLEHNSMVQRGRLEKTSYAQVGADGLCL